MVMLAGIDRSEGDLLKVTVQVAKPFALAHGTQPLIDEKPYWLTSSTGHTFFQAVRNLTNQSPRRLFWSHDKTFIIGEDLAREGIGDVIDLLFRENEIRDSLHLLVAKGTSAENILEANFELERRPDLAIEGIIKVVAERKSTAIVPTLLEFAREKETDGIEPVIGLVETAPRPTPKKPQYGQIRRETVAASARLSGIGVFKECRLVGYLNERQSRGLLWVKGKVKGGVIVVRHPVEKDKLVSLEILGGTREIIPAIVDGRPKIRVRIEAEANLGETQAEAKLLGDEAFFHSLERRMATAIRNEIESALTAAQDKYQSDVFGFGRSFSGSYPREWQKMKDSWDDIFSALEVQVEVVARLERSGLVLRRIKESGS